MNIRTNKPNKNKFNLSREVKMTGNMGNLYPAFIQDVVPGDSFKVNTQQMVRFSPLLAPMMHRVDFKLDYFFVPYRLVWDEWKDFITGGEDGNDLPSYPRFHANSTNVNTYLQKGALADYMGLPVVADSPEGSAWTSNPGAQYLSVLPFRAYQLIYHEYFRDQNVGDEHTQHTSSGIQATSTLESQLTLRKQNVKPEYTDKNVADSSLSPLSEYFSPATAAPGYSKHNNGKAIDFNTGSRTGNIASPLNDDLYSWLIRNSWKYGFVRTVSTEEWHFEWIGITAASSGPYTKLSPSPVIKDPSKYPNNCYYEDLGLNNLRLIDGEYVSVTPGQPIPLSNV